MKTLNLVDLDKSDIKYKISKFPDGQQDIVIDTNFEDIHIEIQSRLNSFKDLELIIAAKKALDRHNSYYISLYIPYLLGARSDRQFVKGGTSYVVDVIAPIINSLEFESVTVMDVHSDVAAACIKNLKVIDNKQLVGFALKNINNGIVDPHATLNNCVLISPDAGSLKKIYKVADAIGYKGDIITCSKYRDVDGKLSKTDIPAFRGTTNFGKKDYIIIDDICDGGQTFINISKFIRGTNEHRKNNNKIYLIVTHGIFSRGFAELSKYFDGIYCTNSYGNVINTLQVRQFIQQLNVY